MMTVALFFAEAKKNRRFRKNSQPRPGKTRACGEKGRGIRPFGKEKGSSAPASAFGLGFAPSAFAPTLRILLRAFGSSRLSPPLRFCAAGMTFLRPSPAQAPFLRQLAFPRPAGGSFRPFPPFSRRKRPFAPCVFLPRRISPFLVPACASPPMPSAPPVFFRPPFPPLSSFFLHQNRPSGPELSSRGAAARSPGFPAKESRLPPQSRPPLILQLPSRRPPPLLRARNAPRSLFRPQPMRNRTRLAPPHRKKPSIHAPPRAEGL